MEGNLSWIELSILSCTWFSEIGTLPLPSGQSEGNPSWLPSPAPVFPLPTRVAPRPFQRGVLQRPPHQLAQQGLLLREEAIHE